MDLNPHTLEALQKVLALDIVLFLPELTLCFTIILLLFLRLFKMFDGAHLGGASLLLTLFALAVSCMQWTGGNDLVLSPAEVGANTKDLFSGLLVYDYFTIFVRMFLLGTTALLIWLSLLTGIPDREDSADFYCLLLGATLGMSLMASANHLLMVYIGVEMASLPSYALAGFLKGKPRSSEASLKYVVYGGGASGIMLYGISLLAGKFGTAYLPDLATGFVAVLHQTSTSSPVGVDPILVLGTLFVLIGVAFKLAAVPFHFWCPDVFEGAAAEVAAFLSVASKGAALALVGRLTLVLARQTEYTVWLDVAKFLVPSLAFFAALTATFGNLAAYLQTNLKRLLAYSTIAQAGYMMMALAPLSQEGASAILFYLVAYLFMNLGAFAIVAFLRNQTGSEDLESYRGLVQRSPLMTVVLSIFLLSLLGIPPLIGFMAKFQIFSVLYNAGQTYSAGDQPSLGTIMYALLAIGGINTVISAVYYLKVMKVMILDKPVEDSPKSVAVPAGAAFYGTVMAVTIFVLFLAQQPLGEASDKGAIWFHKAPVRPTAEAKP